MSQIADKVSEKNKNNEFSEPFTNSAEQGIISQKDYFDREIVNNENLDGYYIVRNDDFIYNPRISVTAPVGPINRNRLGRTGVMSPLYTVFRTHDIDNLYLEFYFKTTRWHRFMKLNGDSGARFDRFTISSTQFMEMPIPYPTMEEQRKIGEYFDSLDNLITLHHRKCENLQEIRLNDWEQRKVPELLKNSSSAMKIGPFGSALKKEYFVEEGVKVYAQENAFTGDFSIGDYYITEEKYKELQSCELYPGDLVISMMGTIGACAIFPKNAEKGIMNSHLLRLQFNNKVVPKYIMYLLRDSDLIRKQIDRLSVGSIMSGLSSSVVKKLIFPIPELPEQEKIVEYFDSLDHLITLHQRKCEELQKIKKYMLQNMFV